MESSRELTPDVETLQKQESPEQSPPQGQMPQHRGRLVYSQIWKAVCFQALSTATFAFTAWITKGASNTSKVIAGLGINASVTLTVMAVLQGFLSLMVAGSLSNVFELIQWALTGRKRGLSSINVLGLSPTTGILGSLRIIINRRSTWSERWWPLLRLGCTVALWISVVLPFANTSLDTAYDSVLTYKATAGVGPFQGSYVREYIDHLQAMTPGYPYTIVSYEVQAVIYNLVLNPTLVTPVSPIVCTGVNCNSYLLTGGMLLTTPWPPTDYPAASVLTLPDIPAAQIDFQRGIDERDPFSEEDCSLYGDDETLIGVRLCLAKNQSRPNSIHAGLYVCPNGTVHAPCPMTNNPANITTTFSIFNRKATIVSSRSTTEIFASNSLSDPVPYDDLNLTDFRAALSWIMDYNASKTPAPTSLAGEFWSGQTQLESVYWSTELTQSFQGLLTFPFWAFQDNNFGNIRENRQVISTTLPDEFYTDASLAITRERIVIDSTMLTIFIIVQAIIHLFTWGVFVWLLLVRPALPEISSYPLLDYAVKTRYSAAAPDSKLRPPSPLSVSVDELRADDRQFLSALNHYRSLLSIPTKDEGAAEESVDQLTQRLEVVSLASSQATTARSSIQRESSPSLELRPSAEHPFLSGHQREIPSP